MPRSTAKLVDLSRRMSAVALFRDVKLAQRPVDETLTLHDIVNRLGSLDFHSGGVGTDLEALRALVALLDTAIGGAGFLMREHSGAKDADRKFDADIDDLAFRLKMVHDKIHDNNDSSRKETKSCIDLLAKRLTYVVRKRPPPKTGDFDTEPSGEDANVPKQRAFMKKWAQKKAERRDAALANGSRDIDGGIE